VKTLTQARHDEFDHLLRGPTPLGKLKSFGLDLPSALALHADFASREFSAPCLASACEGCGQHQSESTVSFSWKGIFGTAGTVVSTLVGLLVALGGHGFTVHQVIEFQTHHALCRGCHRRARWMRHVGEWMEHLTFLLLLIGFSLSLFTAIVAAIHIGGRMSPREVTLILVGLAGSSSALASAWFLGKHAPACGVPRQLKFIAKRPFRLVGVRPFD